MSDDGVEYTHSGYFSYSGIWDTASADALTAAPLSADAVRRAVARLRNDGVQPSVMVVPPWMMEWPQRLAFLGYTTLDRTRPWPRIVLFPRWDAMVERQRQRWRLQRMRWWWEDRRG